MKENKMPQRGKYHKPYKLQGGRHSTGDPHTNLCLEVLLEAKKFNTEMWRDYVKDHNMSNLNKNSFEIALWVAHWWKRYLAREN